MAGHVSAIFVFTILPLSGLARQPMMLGKPAHDAEFVARRGRYFSAKPR
jgi:hypothetical protein